MPAHFLNRAENRLEKWMDEEFQDHPDIKFHKYCVVVQHQDGTSFTFTSAFALEWTETLGDNEVEVLGVVSEHQGDHVFAVGDLRYYGQFERCQTFSLNPVDEGVC